MVNGKLFLFAALFLEAKQKPFPGRIIVFDLEIHDGADPGERVGKDPEQKISELTVRGTAGRLGDASQSHLGENASPQRCNPADRSSTGS